jgi:hypothetical protein
VKLEFDETFLMLLLEGELNHQQIDVKKRKKYLGRK